MYPARLSSNYRVVGPINLIGYLLSGHFLVVPSGPTSLLLQSLGPALLPGTHM